MKEGLWNLFLATGSIGAYLAYKNLADSNNDFDNNIANVIEKRDLTRAARNQLG